MAEDRGTIVERTELIALSDSGSLVVEAYRSVRSSIHAAGADMRVVEMTGVVPDEGKSVFAANVAVVMAQAGKKVLLIDCDFAHPMQHVLFQLGNRGLFEAVNSESEVSAFCQPTKQTGLSLLTVGKMALPDLLSSERFPEILEGLKKDYDYILLDAPAVLASADALAAAACADGVVLVIESGKEEPKTARLAKKRLEQAKANVLGCVLNSVKVDGRYDQLYRMRGATG